MSENQPPQSQTPPGSTQHMEPRPRDTMDGYEGRDLLRDKCALITGGDSGIGRAVAVAFAKEGADVAFTYLNEHDDASVTERLIAASGRRCVAIPGDLVDPDRCRHAVNATVSELGGIQVLVNNVATQRPLESVDDLTAEQWLHTFNTNVHSYFHVTAAALPHLGEGSAIVNTGSVNGLRGNKTLVDYSAAKGAVHSWTFAMAQALVDRGIRVNCVAPGPVWTPLIPSTFDEERVAEFGKHAPYQRPAEPDELAPSYVFLACDRLSSYYTGQIFGALGGEIA